MDRIRRAAREVFGYDELRPGQREAVEAAIGGRDVLAVMSTGYGKSAIYQIAALLIPGPTVVVSPLLALQREQIEELDAQATGGAAGVNSLASEGERREALDDLGAHRRGGRGGEGDDGGVPQLVDHVPQAEVVGPEVVPP